MIANSLSRWLLLGSVTTLLTAQSSPAAAADWYRWRGPDLNGISKEAGWNAAALNGTPKILWKAEIGIGFSSFSVSEGRVYTSGNKDSKDTVFCFDAASGKVLWQYTYDAPIDAKYYEGGTSATPTVDGKVVYGLSKRGHLYSLDAATGKVVWEKNVAEETGAKVPTWGFASSPVVVGDTLLINVGKAGLALEKATGKILWQTGTEAAGYSSAVPCELAGKKCFAVLGANALYVVEISSGKIVAESPWKTNYDVNAADPIVNGTQMFISSSYGKGCGMVDFSSAEPKQVWANKNMRNHFNSCVLLDGYLYGCSGEAGQQSHLMCLDWKTGEIKWTEKSVGLGAVMAADGKLIVLGDKGELIIAKAQPSGFEALSRAQVLSGKCWTTPVLSGGRIYCRNAKGNVVCVEAK